MTEKILMCGNEALAEAAILSGCRFYAGYPITPQNELCEYMARRMPEVGGTFIQAESELAAINMVFGASVAGARAITSSSSPGISLKQEGISYLAGCELPAVIVNIMRGGPGLGNIAPSQSDYFQAVKGGGHGDYHCIVLAPASVQEMADITRLAFELADRYRTPVMILGDGLLGQMMEPLIMTGGTPVLPTTDETPVLLDKDIKRDKPWALTGCKGRPPNIIRSLLLEEGALEELNMRLKGRYDEIASKETRLEGLFLEDSDIILVAYGTTSRICKGAMKEARAGGIKVGMIRPITLFPFPSEAIAKASKDVDAFLTVEMSTGQMVEDVRLAVEGRSRVEFYGRTGGGIPSKEDILGRIKSM